jgi:hypothetical protein
MTEEIKKQVHELHSSIMERPNQILQFFQDFFGEGRVEMQGFLTEDELYIYLSVNPLGTFIEWTNITDSSAYQNMNREDREVINLFWTAEGANNETVTSDSALAKYFLPVIKEKIANTMFNNLFILIYFPTVRITNEYGKFVDIKDLWLKVPFNWKGKGKGYFGVNRSNYPLNHFKSNYMHSHVSSIPTEDFEKFQTPCTGRGPINSSLSTLAIGYDEAIWQLLCLELDRYVRVESIDGVPHHRLENIPVSEMGDAKDKFSMQSLRGVIPRSGIFGREQFKPFIKHLLETKKIRFNYSNGSYGIRMSFIDTVVLISNEFISWYNTEYNKHTFDISYADLVSNGIINECTITNGKVYIPRAVRRNSSDDYQRYVGRKICTFKGREITLTIEGILSSEEESLNRTRILNLQYIEAIVCSMLRILNYGYGREERSETSAGVSPQTGYI